MNLLVFLLVNSVAVFVTAYILPGVELKDFLTAIIVTIILGVVNTFIKPVLLLFTLPLNIVTLGLFTFVINACIILLVSRLVTGFEVQSFWWALLFSVVLSLISSFLRSFVE